MKSKKHNMPVRIALCQINPTVGDINGNALKIIEFIEKAKKAGADLAVFPELSLTGYPPEDLLEKSHFIADNLKALKEVVAASSGITVIAGFVNRKSGLLYNSAAIMKDKKLFSVYDKMQLPNYGVFDEKRYFSPGKKNLVFKSSGLSVGIVICEDIWEDAGPIKAIVKSGVDLIIAINASPYYVYKWKVRENRAKEIAKRARASFAYLNLVGGQDELVFDGHSFVLNEKGKIIARGKQFEEDIIIFELPCSTAPCHPVTLSPFPRLKEIYSALCLGLKDYVAKNGFKSVIFGLSGGIDSALVAAIAADALGNKNVKAFFMPSQYTADQSRDDSVNLAGNLGIELLEIPIKPIFSQYSEGLQPFFKGAAPNIAEENLQARIRGNLLMAFSNKFGYLVLATGNKSEVSTGYATLYGDMAGGLSVIKDVPKTLVYELVKYRNSISNVIPQSIIDRPPTAELKPGQKDQDTLPPYDLLDKIIFEYVENDKSAEELIKNGLDKETVLRTISMIDKNEYKRRQSAPGIKITPKAFGKDRRMPITNGYK